MNERHAVPGRHVDRRSPSQNPSCHSDAFRALFREGMELVESTAAYLDGAGREESKALPRMMRAVLCQREHAPDDPPDAARLLAAAAARRGRGRAERRPGATRRRTRCGCPTRRRSMARKARTRCPSSCGRWSPSPCGCRTRIIHLDQLMDGQAEAAPDAAQPRRAAAPPAPGVLGLKAEIAPPASAAPLRSRRHQLVQARCCRERCVRDCRSRSRRRHRRSNAKSPVMPGLSRVRRSCEASGREAGGVTHFLARPKPSKRLLKRDRRPPRSSSCCWPPVQAGCDLRVDVELHHVAFLAPGRAGVELGAIGHDDLDGVVVGMDVGLHE